MTKELSIPVTSIELDPQNPRIAWITSDIHTTADLFNEHWKSEKILDIVKSVDKIGLYPFEKIIVIEQIPSLKYTVIEGNRRVVAFRSILDPTLAPQNQRKYLLEVKERRKSSLEEISVCVFPSKDTVLPIVQQKHASSDTSSWTPLMRARFYWDDVRSHPELSLDQIAERFIASRSEFLDFYKKYALYSLVKKISTFSNDQKEEIFNERRFPITTLERIVQVKSICTDLGLSDNWDISDEEFQHFELKIKPIIIDIIEGKVDSRTLNSTRDILSYYDSIKKASRPLQETKILDQNHANKTESFGLNEPSTNHPKPSVSLDIPVISRPPREKSPLNSVFRSKVKYCLTGYDSFRQLFETLRKDLKPDKNPTACGILLRSFLEKGTRILFERKGIGKVLLEKFFWESGKKETKSQEYPVTDDKVKFRMLLDKTSKEPHAKALGMTPDMQANMRIFIHGLESAPSILEKLNNLAHKPGGEITSDELSSL